jgi:hypothetical protein
VDGHLQGLGVNYHPLGLCLMAEGPPSLGPSDGLAHALTRFNLAYMNTIGKINNTLKLIVHNKYLISFLYIYIIS